MSNLQKDFLIGLLFLLGIFGFMSGDFLVSTLSFASASVFSMNQKN